MSKSLQQNRPVDQPTDHSAGLSKLNMPRRKDRPSITQPTEVHNILNDTTPDDIMWDTVITKVDIEEQFLTSIREAFRAASKSPCCHGISFSSLSLEADQILHGSIPPDWHSDDPLIMEFVASYGIPPHDLPRNALTTATAPEDTTKGFKSWKEMTTASPFERHLGHYKGIIQDPDRLKCLHNFLTIPSNKA